VYLNASVRRLVAGFGAPAGKNATDMCACR
jgi:hypothetical protein